MSIVNLRFIISIDTLGREILTAPGGSADVSLTVGHGSDGLKELLAKVYTLQLRTCTLSSNIITTAAILTILFIMTKVYKNMHWDDFDYPADLKNRDVMDLPGYHHRDDCIVLWDAILEYVQGGQIPYTHYKY